METSPFSQPAEDFVIFTGDEGVVYLAEIRAPAAQHLDDVAAECEVGANRKRCSEDTKGDDEIQPDHF